MLPSITESASEISTLQMDQSNEELNNQFVEYIKIVSPIFVFAVPLEGRGFLRGAYFMWMLIHFSTIEREVSQGENMIKCD